MCTYCTGLIAKGNVCSGQHRFFNEFSGNGSGKPHLHFYLFHISGECTWSYGSWRARSYLLHAFSQGGKNVAALEPWLYELCSWGFTCGFTWFKAAVRVGGVALLRGLFSLDGLTFELVLRASAAWSVCQRKLLAHCHHFSQILAAVIKKNVHNKKNEPQ